MVILFPPRAQVAFQALGRQQRSCVLTGPGWELGAWWQRLGDRVGAELVGPWRKGVGLATRQTRKSGLGVGEGEEGEKVRGEGG